MTDRTSYILYAISALITAFGIYYFSSTYIECSDKGGTLIRTVWTGWKCVKIEELK